MLIWVPLLLFAVAWVVTETRLPVLPLVLAAGLAALACQTLLLLGTKASGGVALLAACGGYAAAVVVGALALHFFGITGIYSPIMSDLWYAPGTHNLTFHWLTLGGIALSGAGVIADLAVVITATIEEVHRANPSLSAGELLSSGMSCGRDVIGTELNTLPPAILGTALGGLLLVLARPDVARWPYSWMLLANRQCSAVETVALAAGTIGLTITIPLTALLVSRKLGKTQQTKPIRTNSRTRLFPTLALCASFLVFAALVVGFSVWLGRTTYRYPSDGRGTQTSLIRGSVLRASPSVSPWTKRDRRQEAEMMQTLLVRLPDESTLRVENPLTGSPAHDRVPVVGNGIIVRVQKAGDDVYAALSELERNRGLLILLLATGATVLVVAGWQGWRALAALALSLLVVASFLVAVMIWHAPPVMTTVLCALVITGLSYLILCGWSRKALCASIGALIGLGSAAIAAVAFGAWLGLSGRHDSDLLTLAMYSAGRSLDFRALLASAALIGALGVTMDVAIAVASATSEVRRADPRLGFRRLLSAGFEVGSKAMAAMFGAILFAYRGADYSFRRMIEDVLPGSKLEPVAADHPIFRELYPLAEIPKVVDLYGGPARAFAVVREKRLVVLYTYDTDIPCAWERYPDGSYVHVIDETKREAAIRFGINLLLHALRQHLGKASPPTIAAPKTPLPQGKPLPAGAVTNYPMQRQLPCNHITAIAADDRFVWVGGFSYMPGEDEGLARYDKRANRWRVFMDAEGILSEEVNCLALMENKVLVGSDTWK